MIVSRKSFALLALAGLASVATATDVTAINGTQGWVVNGASGGGAASLGTTYSGIGNHQDGALVMNGDRIRIALGRGDEGGANLLNYGTLGALAEGSMSFDFFRSSVSMTNDVRLNVAVKLFLSNGSSLTWENAYNASLTDSDTWHNDYQIGGASGKWFVRQSGVSYDQSGQQFTLAQYAAGQTATHTGPNTTSSALSGSLNIVGVSFAIGSTISKAPGTFYGAADNLKLNFGGGNSYAYNFRDPSYVSPTVPAPAAMSAFALGLAGRLRRRKRA